MPAGQYALRRSPSGATPLKCRRVVSFATQYGRGDLATQQVDAYLYALALRNLVRAAEFVRNQATGPSRGAIESEYARFQRRVPDAVHIRDVLEHFDVYKRGRDRRRPLLLAIPASYGTRGMALPTCSPSACRARGRCISTSRQHSRQSTTWCAASKTPSPTPRDRPTDIRITFRLVIRSSRERQRH